MKPRRGAGVIALAVAALAMALLQLSASGDGAPRSTKEPMNAPDTPRKPNRLAREKSPYLLQHAYNPVDWYPWGEEAFAAARAANRPIFLSIGYSTCHWCHVMERESFENDSVAELLNTYFVPVKVDREERPDVDRIYMHAAQAMGMGGGWPLNVFLTPDLEPFYGGTYFPPRSQIGRPGMMELLPRVHEVWTERGDELVQQGRRVFEALDSLNAPAGDTRAREALFEQAYSYLERAHDAEQGGFGNAPKFPSTVNLNFLLRMSVADSARFPQARDMALHQLDVMRRAGIHDHLGGGFHRYATDRNWLVPHFEKMLYDQAQLAWAYLEAFQITRDAHHAAAVRGIFDYVARDLTAPEGGFYSAEDADSEGEEGRFYVWTPEQVGAVLGAEDAKLFMQHYGVTERGNFEHGTSILSEVQTLQETAATFGAAPGDVSVRLEHARRRLLDARAQRIRPHLDDKVLTAWNGLMISACARGARVLGDATLRARAERAADFVWARLYDSGQRTLKRRWRDGEAAGAGQLDDYAYFALACFDLYQTTFDPLWLERAVRLTEDQISYFWDPAHGGFFESPEGDASIRIRMKDGFDGAEMAGNSIAVLNLVQLGRLLDREEWLTKARQSFDYFATRLSSGAASMPQMLVAMDLDRAVPRHIVIAGAPDAADTRDMIDAFNRRFLPHDALLVVDDGTLRTRLSRMVPFVEPLISNSGRATAYVCVNYACRLPTNELHTFAAQLDDTQGPAPAMESPR